MLIDKDNKNINQFITKLFNWMKDEGQTKYDESVTQLDHSIQTAMLAKRYNANSSLVVASLLHDIGHLILNENESKIDFLYYDLNHEMVGAKWLEKIFPQSVTEPIKLHVPAKRYLCTIKKNYYEKLSFSSKQSFILQGGIMSTEEENEFINNQYFMDALKLRTWDEKAKRKNMTLLPINNFKKDILSVIKKESIYD
ncbi:MAG: HD domain-containing protein [Alphaproteobacteria bacterium]|jgi:predicted HD phosphohydrolase|nr:HD domain-containing protein [Alphaproteobacteria bacterium]